MEEHGVDLPLLTCVVGPVLQRGGTGNTDVSVSRLRVK